MSFVDKKTVLPGRGPLFAGLAMSVCLHVGILMPGEYEQIKHSWSPQSLQVELVTPKSLQDAATTRSPLERPSAIASPTPPEAQQAIGPAIPPATPPEQELAVAEAPVPDSTVGPPSPQGVKPLTGDDLWVWELFPEQLGEFLLEVDPAVFWHDLRTLRKRPLIRGDLLLLLPSEYLQSNAGERAVVEIKVMPDGALHGIRLLTPESLFGRSLADALAQLQFIPGEFQGKAVHAVMYIEFKLPNNAVQQP